MNCSIDLKNFTDSLPSASNFKSFSRSLEQFFLTVVQNNFGNKIPFLCREEDGRKTDYWAIMLHKRACWWKSQFSTGLNNRKTIGSLFQVLRFSMEEIQSYKVYVIYNGINLEFLLGLFFLNWLFSMLLFLFTKFYWVKTILYIWDSAIFFSEVWCQDLDD